MVCVHNGIRCVVFSPNEKYDHLVLKNPHQINFYQIQEVERLYERICCLPGKCMSALWNYVDCVKCPQPVFTV